VCVCVHTTCWWVICDPYLFINRNSMSGLCSYYTHYFITVGCVLLCFVYWLKYPDVGNVEYRTYLDNSCINLFKLAVLIPWYQVLNNSHVVDYALCTGTLWVVLTHLWSFAHTFGPYKTPCRCCTLFFKFHSSGTSFIISWVSQIKYIIWGSKCYEEISIFEETGNLIKWLWQLKLILVLEYFGAVLLWFIVWSLCLTFIFNYVIMSMGYPLFCTICNIVSISGCLPWGIIKGRDVHSVDKKNYKLTVFVL
jgi:hypothetical protein